MHCIAPTNDPAGPASPAANRRSCLCYYHIPVHRSPLLIFCHLFPPYSKRSNTAQLAYLRREPLEPATGQARTAQPSSGYPARHPIVPLAHFCTHRDRVPVVQYSTGRFASCRIISHRIKSHYINFTVRFFPDRPPIPTRPPFYSVAPSPGVSRLLIHRLAPAIPSLWPGFVLFPSFPTSFVVVSKFSLPYYTPTSSLHPHWARAHPPPCYLLDLAFIYLCTPSFNPRFLPFLPAARFFLYPLFLQEQAFSNLTLALSVPDPSCRLTIMATAHMAVRTDTFPHSTSRSHSHSHQSMGARIIPIPTPTIKMSPPSNGDPMEITSPAPSSNGNHNSDSEANGNGQSNDRPKNSPAPDSNTVTSNSVNNSNSMPAPPPAAAAVHQPKIVQTAFIHKLYK